MALEEIQQGSPPQGRDLSQALKELQGLTFSLVAGAAADADIAIAGYSASGGDTVVKVLQFDGAGTSVTDVIDRTSELQAGSVDGAIQLSTTSTAGDKLLVIWFNKGAL